ncbi:AgmX/PglI C-terminal domain-containing protein [Halobacteriovorax sp. HLS]|uniref:AgmX/PglI C-terminal domain-containing protein n=1 Tax=Halobacteriovorax sp. HLS TaxID=2234000 RepID=UPI000FDA1853|nr:AgmX/PglI C-terminal domain-containing protein [Halobacteriovorax sp. HLS]
MNMDVQTELKDLFELLPVGAASGQKGQVVKRKRVLVGSSSACDIHIDHPTVSPIHAVIEVVDGKFKIFDMDSPIGTYLNGKKIVSQEFQIEDSIKFGSIEFQFKNYSSDDLPPPLEMLAPIQKKKETIKKVLPKSAPVKETKSLPIEPPRVEYPLGADPKADFSEYIFEDVETLYPIFDYSPTKKSVEIIILHNERVYSVDYLPVKDGVFNLVGSKAGSRDVEYAYLGKTEKVPFVEIRGNDVFINSLHGYESMSLSDSKKDTAASQILLGNDDIIRFVNGDLQIYVRGTDAPPKVAHAPIMRRDKEFIKWLILVFLFCLMFLGFFTFYAVDEEIEKEKVPERIATILYKKKLTVSKTKAIDKTKDKPKEKIQKSPQQKKVTKVAVKKQDVKKVETKKANVKSGSKKAISKAPAKKATANKGPVDKKMDQVSKPKKTGGKASNSKSTANKKVANSKSKGAVDVFKSADFSSSLSSLMAKGGSVKSAQAVNTLDSSSGNEASIGGSDSATLKRAKVSNNVGSLTGATSGKLDSSKGVSGLVNKKNIYTAGVPFEEVVLGGMDPDVIRRILIDNIPQFRYCYQQELDRAKAAFNGIVRLDFIIGASGHVSKASVESASKALPSKVKGCVVNVLKGIRFPEPLGGGVVEVNQPFNFYPKRK